MNILRRLTEEELKMRNTEINIADLYEKLVGFTYSRDRNYGIHNENFDKLELRHSDENWGDPYEVNEKVLVNFFGTVYTNKEIDLPYTSSLGYKYNTIYPENDQFIEYDYISTNLFDYLYNLPYIVSVLNQENSTDEHWQNFQYDKEGNRLW